MDLRKWFSKHGQWITIPLSLSLIFILVTVAIAVASQGSRSNGVAASTKIVVTAIDPKQVAVSIDGKPAVEIGNCPCEFVVSPGSHHVEVSAPKRVGQFLNLDVASGSETKIEAKLTFTPEGKREAQNSSAAGGLLAMLFFFVFLIFCAAGASPPSH